MSWRRRRTFSTGNPIFEGVTFSAERFYLAKLHRQPLWSKEIRIKCGNSFHRISLRFPGPITLLNHKDKGEEKMLMRLGGDKPDCLVFLEQWKASCTRYHSYQGNTPILNGRPLMKEFDRYRTEATGFRQVNKDRRNDWMTKPFPDRLRIRVEEIYSQLKVSVNKHFKLDGYHNRPPISKEELAERVLVPKVRLEFIDMRKSLDEGVEINLNEKELKE